MGLVAVWYALGHGIARGTPAAVVATALFGACAGGQAVNGTNVEQVFSDPGTRALADAAARGDAAEVSRLVRAGADPNGRGRDGVVPLSWAMGRRSYEGMRALLAAGADPNAQSAPGLKPLEMAAASGDPELLRILLDAKGNPNARNSNGEPLLFVAVMHNQPANIRLLVERGADLNAVNNTHTTPALLASSTSRWDLVAWLLEHGADPSIPANTGGTIAYRLERDGPPRDAGARRHYERTRALLVARGVKFPAERPAAVRARVFGPGNPIDAGAGGDARAGAPTP